MSDTNARNQGNFAEDPFISESVEESVEDSLADSLGTDAPLTPLAALIRSLADAYSLPPAAEPVLARSRATLARRAEALSNGTLPTAEEQVIPTDSGPDAARLSTRPQPSPRRRFAPLASAWRTVAAVLIVTLLVAGFFALFHQRTPQGTHPTPAPTPTRTAPTPTATLPPTPLSWENVTFPAPYIGGFVSDNLGQLAVAPGDGNTAYACATPTSHNGAPDTVGTTMWVSHDRAQHWTRLAPLPVVPQLLTSCWIVPDAVDQSIVVAGDWWAREQAAVGEPRFMQSAQFVSFDGGAQWQSLTGSKPFAVRWLATYHGTTMAEVDTDVPGNEAFWISHDEMRTWQASSTAALQYTGIVINPTTGDLLGVGGTLADLTPVPVETSNDFGLHWTTIATPTGAIPLVSPPDGSQPWRMCVVAEATANVSNTGGSLLCSMNGGKTWSQRPQLAITINVAYRGPTTQIATAVAVGPDGTVYAEVPAFTYTSTLDTLYRLSPGSDRWQSLGVSPVDVLPSSVGYATAYLPGAGIFWYSGFEEFTLFNP